MEPDQSVDANDMLGVMRYINASREQPRVTQVSYEGVQDTPKPKFWKKREIPEFVTPDEWLETNITTGLSQAESGMRRSKSGWNELTTEEKLFRKLLSYFTGPIPYGKAS